MSGFLRRNYVSSVLIMAGILGLTVLLYVHGHATEQRRGVEAKTRTDYFYPRLPSNLRYAGSPVGAPLLRKSKHLSGIVAWAEQNLVGAQFHSVLSQRRGATCFIVIYDIGSGIRVFSYVLYAWRGNITDGGWEAVAVGPVGESEDHWDYIRSVYFSDLRRELVFAGRGDEEIRRIPLAPSWWIK